MTALPLLSCIPRLRALAVAGAVLAFAVNAASAQTSVSFVSVTGNDSNSCTLAAPCRLLQRAVDTLPLSGGVVEVLNSGDYGGATHRVTIAKHVTLNGRGNIVFRTAIEINNTIPTAPVVVVLRDLVLDGAGLGFTGIRIAAAAAVHIENCEVGRFKNGIALDSASELFITDSVSRDHDFNGLRIEPAGKVTIENSRFENNGLHGLQITSSALTITRSIVSGNAGNGILQTGGTTSASWTTAANNALGGFVVTGSGQMTLESSVASGNKYGLAVNSATAQISTSVFTDNGHGINNTGGKVLTRQNNTVSGNGSNVVGTVTPLAEV